MLIFLSAGLNLALLLLFVALFRSGATKPESAKSNSDARQSQRSERARHSSRASSQWSQLESSDLAVYAANLRAAGCPAKTIRDILLPLVEEKYALPEMFDSEPTNFWASFSQRQAAAKARADEENQLKQKKEEMLNALLGFAWTSERLKQAYDSKVAGSIGFLDYEAAEKFLCVCERFKEQFSIAAGSHRKDHRKEIYAAWSKEVSEVVSSAELEEIELRGLLMFYQRHNPTLCNAGLTGPELRQLMTYRRERCHALPSAFFTGVDELVQEPDWLDEQKFNAKARTLLGDNRFLDYLRTCDASIERTLAVLEKERLPRSLALELFDLRQDAVARAEEIRLRPMRLADKRAQLAALHGNALEQLTTLPGAADESPILEINRDWLQQIKNP